MGQTHLVEVDPAAPAPRTGGGGKPPLWVQERASLSPDSVGRALDTAGTHRAVGSIALRSRSRPNPSLRPPRPIRFQNLGDA